MLAHLAAAGSELDQPLLKVREARTTALVVVTADRGLCGAYNASLIRAAEHRLRGATPGALQLVLVGKKARDYFRRRKFPVIASHVDLPAEADLDFVRRLTADLIELFTSGRVDRIELLYTQFISALRRRITTEVFLPVGEAAAGAETTDHGTIFEPDADAIFAELLPRYATARLFAAMADALASEHGARMIAMGSARKNAGEILDLLVLRRNRLRQAIITKELAEIVGGAEVLK